MIRWVRGLDSEVGFWHSLLDPNNTNNPDVDSDAWKSAHDWLQTGAKISRLIASVGVSKLTVLEVKNI